MDIISWIFFGLIAGVIAKFLMPGRDGGGLIMTILLGIAGSFLGGWIGKEFGIGRELGFGTMSGFNMASFFTAVVGALILLFIYRVLKR
ncbi:MAG: GlsB/YeaQ/YmgE family stress response membrane protein [Oceanisphaera sp.]|uniref:GlsB/YeaQ/YmgE family stress response membrane protein n=1 Tax=Oceanisphaera sp. TaxID=1929979 RepID=UPI003F9C5218